MTEIPTSTTYTLNELYTEEKVPLLRRLELTRPESGIENNCPFCKIRRLGLTRPESGIEHNCLFCKIANYDPYKQLVFFDDLVSIFKDINPRAKLHLQAVPRKHIKNVDTLTPEDIGLLNHMELKSNEVAEKISWEQGLPFDERTQGFHVPPFISQNHLHLHTVVSPFSENSFHARKTDIYSNSNRLGIYRINDVTDDLKNYGTVNYHSLHR